MLLIKQWKYVADSIIWQFYIYCKKNCIIISLKILLENDIFQWKNGVFQLFKIK